MSESDKKRIGNSGDPVITVGRDLTKAQRRITEGRRGIAEQRRRVHELRRRGLDTTEAKRALAALVDKVRLCEQDRDRIRRELESNT